MPCLDIYELVQVQENPHPHAVDLLPHSEPNEVQVLLDCLLSHRIMRVIYIYKR